MKKTLMVLLIFYVTLKGVSYAQTKEPFGFRDVKLGQDISTVRGAYKTKEATRVFEGWTVYYKCIYDKLSIGDISCDDIEYSTFLGRIYRIQITSKDLRKELLKDMLIKLYGEPLKAKHYESGIYDHYLENVFWKFNNGIQINYKNIQFENDTQNFVWIEYVLLNLEAECYEYMKKIHEEHEKATIEEGAQNF